LERDCRKTKEDSSRDIDTLLQFGNDHHLQISKSSYRVTQRLTQESYIYAEAKAKADAESF
jgi:hypothetical protein